MSAGASIIFFAHEAQMHSYIYSSIVWWCCFDCAAHFVFVSLITGTSKSSDILPASTLNASWVTWGFLAWTQTQPKQMQYTMCYKLTLLVVDLRLFHSVYSVKQRAHLLQKAASKAPIQTVDWRCTKTKLLKCSKVVESKQDAEFKTEYVICEDDKEFWPPTFHHFFKCLLSQHVEKSQPNSLTL